MGLSSLLFGSMLGIGLGINYSGWVGMGYMNFDFYSWLVDRLRNWLYYFRGFESFWMKIVGEGRYKIGICYLMVSTELEFSNDVQNYTY